MPEQDDGGRRTLAELKEIVADVIRNTVMQKVNTVQELAESNQSEIDDLSERLDEQAAEIERLKEMHAAIAGLADSEETTAKKRRRDLLTTLQRKAEGNAGKAEMDYNEVLDQWRILGHETADTSLYAKQAYRAMDKLSSLDGVQFKDDQRPKAVRINLDEFDSSTAFAAFDNVNNFEEAKAQQNTAIHGD